MPLSRLLVLLATLVLACASAQAHVGAFGSAAESARRGFLPDLGAASRVFARVTAGRVWENYDCADRSASALCVDAFGVEIGRSGTTDIAHLYRGERFDANVGFYDLRARLYNPAIGRFLTQDSFAGFSMDPASLHRFNYAQGDPVNAFDPSGNFAISHGIATSLLVSASISTAIRLGSRTLTRAALARIAVATATATVGVAVVLDSATRETIMECMQSSKKGSSNCKPRYPIFIVGDDNNEIRDHIGDAQAEGKAGMLSRRDPPHGLGWLNVHKGPGKACNGGAGTQCDEYPWRAANEGGAHGNVSLRSVNGRQNSTVGAYLRWFHSHCKIPANTNVDKYRVLAVKNVPQTGYICGR